MRSLSARLAASLRSRSLMRAGHRVAVAVSGGADSVGLLRLLLELRGELGIVLAVAHFHHGIRGADADADESFVAELAKAYDLPIYLERSDALKFAAEHKISLETAARDLRHRFFVNLLESGSIDRIATAHTLDDQAETVLMKFARGAGTRGLSGIFPEQKLSVGSIVRPLLEIRREEIRDYLRGIDQPWREDESNTDLNFTRNRVRARVLPVLRETVNPSIDVALAHSAEIARAEEEYWNEQIARLLPLVLVPGEPARGGGRRQTSVASVALDLAKLHQHPLALQRRLLRAAGERLGCNLDFEHVQAIIELLAQRSSVGARNRTIEIAKGWRARLLFRELRIEPALKQDARGYEHHLPVPGEVRVSELGIVIHARILQSAPETATHNHALLIELHSSSELLVRPWRAGDRFQPARHGSPKKLKELLYSMHLSDEEKNLWPVVSLEGQILWVRGVDSPELRTASGQQLCIDESRE